MAKRSDGVRDVMNWNFKYWDMPQEWRDHLGDLPEQFNMYIDGDGGHGKTEFLMQLSKMMALHFGKTHLFNFEQGKHNQIKISANRNNFEELLSTGKWMYARDVANLDQLYAKLEKRNSGRVIILDSISFLELTYAQVRDLINAFPRKNFICVAYAADFSKYKSIRHLFDIKTRVENFKAKVQSNRHGGTKDWVIWDKKEAKKDPFKGTLFEKTTSAKATVVEEGGSDD